MKKDYSSITIEGIELVMAIDNIGGVGEKPADFVKAPYDVVSYYGARTVLMEAMCGDAIPIIITLSNFCGESALPKLIEGLNKAVSELSYPIEINGSTESNFDLVQSAITTQVIARRNVSSNRRYDSYCVIGKPLVGNEVTKESDYIVSLSDVEELLTLPYISRVVPVGSKGIKWEFENSFDGAMTCDLDIYKSSGPSTCVLVEYDQKHFNHLESKFSHILYRVSVENRD